MTSAMLAGYHATESLQVRAVLQRTLNVGAALYSDDDGIGYVLLALELAVTALRDSVSFAMGIEWVIRHGGDKDMNAAIAGGLLGARFRLSGIPAEWIRDLQRKDVLKAALLRTAYEQ